MMPGLTACTTSYPSPSRSMAPGAKFSTMTSARFTMFLTRSSPRSDLRLTVMDFLLALNNRKYQESRFWLGLGLGPDCRPNKERPASPPCGFSTLTTSAPSQASASVQDGPASNWVRSRTRTPARKAGNPPFVAIFSSSLQWHVPSAFGQSKQTACSDDLNSKDITFVASMNLDVSLVAAQPSRSGYRELSTLRRKRWPPIGPHRRAGAETSLIDFAALHMSAFGTKRTFRHV